MPEQVMQGGPEFVQWLATLGVGGVLAGLMFIFYRKDVKQYTDLWRISTEQHMQVIRENTASNAKLITLIESQERNMIRKSDLESIIDGRILWAKKTLQ